MTAARTIWHLSRDGASDSRELVVPIPLRTTNPLNGSHRHWAVRARIRKQQRGTTCLVVSGHLARFADRPLPACVTLVRYGPSNGLDDDNLRASLKAVRDGVADALGVDDRDPRVTWAYEQRREKAWGVEIRIGRPP